MKGAVFIRAKGAKDNGIGDATHHWFVISNHDSDDNVLIVNMTTTRNNGREDLSCKLHPGEHPNVTSESHIAYIHAKEANRFKIGLGEHQKTVIRRENASDEVIKRIQDGAKSSPRFPGELKKYFNNF